MRDLELLAPARTCDIGIAAIDCGADAVYIAGPEFGARQAAGNSIEDIRRLCDHAHKFGARIFAALNTIIYDDEMERAFRLMEDLQEAGADAIIIQDLGLTETARRIAGISRDIRIPLHASTQCAIRTPERAAFLESLGFSRLILERELSLEEIAAIRKAVSCELEFFVHGALCVCYSGQCYISENIAGRSANRGSCIQACRSLYDLTDENGKKLVSSRPLLSLKDYCLKDRMEDLAAAGISSFKIEGRLKNISYVRNITRDYSLALDRIVEARPDLYRRASWGKSSGGFIPAPDKTFNRGYTELYLDGKRGQWASTDAAKSMGEHVGTAEILSRDKSAIRIRPTKSGLSLSNGDGFCFVSGRNEVIGFRADVCNGLEIRCKPVPELFSGAALFRNIDTSFEKELETCSPERMIRVSVNISRESPENGCRLSVAAETEDGRKFRGTIGDGAEPARNTENMKKTLVSQLSKSVGRYSFHVDGFSAGTLPFLPVSAVNAFRRMMAEEIDSENCIGIPLYRNTAAAEKPVRTDRDFTYRDNISNRVAAGLAAAAGSGKVEQAYELARPKGAELMRSRYCIRYQFGRCPKYHLRSWPERLFLKNNGRTFALGFDCRNCEMIVREA